MSSPVAVFRESQSLIEGESTGWRSILQSLDIPRTFIFGEQSLPDPDLDLLKEQGIHTEVLEKAGHSMAWDNPGGLAMAIRNAIDRALTPA
jgi:pimeloyl-ACP methyl ester carboxylesterase